MSIEIARIGGKPRLDGNMMHVLDAAGDLDVFAAGGDTLGRLVDCLETGAAVAVHGGASDLDGEAGDERGKAGDVVALFPLLQGTAPVNILDFGSGHPGPVQQRLHDLGGEVVGTNVAVDTLFRMCSANGGADGINDHG